MTPALATSDPEPWRWPIDVGQYDRRELSRLERLHLGELGMDLLRRHGYRDDPGLWKPIRRLLRPLEAAHTVLRWQPSGVRRQHRFALDAMGLVLVRSGQLGKAFWHWAPSDWTALIGASSPDFLRPWGRWLDSGVRPYVLAYGYLLAGFTGLQAIGRFHRPALAWRIRA